MRPALLLIGVAACDEGGAKTTPTSTTGPDHCGTISADEVWAADLNPHTVSCSVEVLGATLTIAPGTEVRFKGLTSLTATGSETGTAIEAQGSADEPILFTLDGDPAVDAWWYGVGAANTTEADHVLFASTIIEYTGPPAYPVAPWGAIEGYAAQIEIQDVTVRSSDGFGFYFVSDSSFVDGSTGLQVSGCTTSGLIDAANAWTLPAEGADLTGNEVDAVIVKGSGTRASVSGRWEDPGVPYFVSGSYGGSLLVEGTEEEPTVLTWGPGVRVLFGSGAGMSVSAYGGPAALVTEGTEEAPVVASGWNGVDDTESWWTGISFADPSVDELSLLDHLDIGYGGSSAWTSGNIVLRSASPTISSSWIHDSASFGIDMDTYSAPSLVDVTFTDNEWGDTNE